MRSMTDRSLYGTILTYLVDELTRKDKKMKADVCNIPCFTKWQCCNQAEDPRSNASRASRADAVLYRRHEHYLSSVFLRPSYSYRSAFVIILLLALGK